MRACGRGGGRAAQTHGRKVSEHGSAANSAESMFLSNPHIGNRWTLGSDAHAPVGGRRSRSRSRRSVRRRCIHSHRSVDGRRCGRRGRFGGRAGGSRRAPGTCTYACARCSGVLRFQGSELLLEALKHARLQIGPLLVTGDAALQRVDLLVEKIDVVRQLGPILGFLHA